MPVEGATVLVTGASAGIGAALAPMLARRGATVGLVGRRQDRLDAVLEQCGGAAKGHRAWALDLGDVEAAEALAFEAWDAFGHLDVLVNNAAIPMRRRVTDLTLEEIDRTMRVNFHAPVRMTLALLPRMLERGRGSIVMVSSLGGRLGIIHEAAYCASKFALCGWSEAMAIDLWNEPVDVRLILPGAIDTEIWDRPDTDAPIYDGPKEPPSTVAADIVAAIEGDAFEVYTPDMKGVAEFKTSDVDAFLGAVAEMEGGRA